MVSLSQRRNRLICHSIAAHTNTSSLAIGKTCTTKIPIPSISTWRWASAATAAASSSTSSTSNSSSLNPPLLWQQSQQQPQQHQTHNQFPSLIIGAQGHLQPLGTFAEAQAAFLDPDPASVQTLYDLLIQTKMGIVAHYYMDVELQGVLQAVATLLPGRVGIADSLRMGDMAVEMVQHHSCCAIACLGVDFMSESVQAILNKNGYSHIPVYRASAAAIGCSLAESAERITYRAWLQHESSTHNGTTTAKATTTTTKATTTTASSQQPPAALHVVYINTSLETKAVSSSLVPTITCTSSNVLQTLLQASAQIGPHLKVLYGPDTYMGQNLIQLLTTIERGWDDDKIAQDLHPAHNRQTIRTLRDQIVVYPSGNCVVHHMFGQAVVDTVKEHYQDCYVTAHLEVPGEMFQIAMELSLQDRGVVGSTSDILKFISRKVQETATTTPSSPDKQRLRFILGTEAGMVTSIVKSVKEILHHTNTTNNVEVEIIFPVASDAIMATNDTKDSISAELAIVPGVAGGEGCSTAGGCATCPFMKMNDLDALQDVLEMVRDSQQQQQQQEQQSEATVAISARLRKHLPPDRLQGRTIQGRSATDLGSEAILYMREFMKSKRLPDELVQKVLRRTDAANVVVSS